MSCDSRKGCIGLLREIALALHQLIFNERHEPNFKGLMDTLYNYLDLWGLYFALLVLKGNIVKHV